MPARHSLRTMEYCQSYTRKWSFGSIEIAPMTEITYIFYRLRPENDGGNSVACIAEKSESGYTQISAQPKVSTCLICCRVFSPEHIADSYSNCSDRTMKMPGIQRVQVARILRRGRYLFQPNICNNKFALATLFAQ